MILPLLALALCWPLAGQFSVTYSPQGPEVARAVVGRVIPGVAVISVQVCQPFAQNSTIDARRVYAAAPFDMISPELAPAVLTRSVRRNWARVAVQILGGLSSGGALLTVSGVVAATNPISTGLVAAGPILNLLAERLSARIPDPSPFLNVLVRGTLQLPPSGCYEGLALSQYRKGMKKETVTL